MQKIIHMNGNYPLIFVYCDYLEHLYLHILICKNQSPDHNLYEVVGVGGVINFIVPELNDVYSGFVTEQPWRMTCHNLIKNDKDVYMMLLKRFKTNCYDNHFYSDDCLFKSFNAPYGKWSKENNRKLFDEIEKL